MIYFQSHVCYRCNWPWFPKTLFAGVCSYFWASKKNNNSEKWFILSSAVEWRMFPKIFRSINSKSNFSHFHRTSCWMVRQIWLKCEHNCLYTWKLFHTWSGQCGKTSLWFRCFLRVKNSNLYSHKRYVFVIRNGSMLTLPMIYTLYLHIAVGVWRLYWTYVDTYSIIKFRKYYWISKRIALNPWGNYSDWENYFTIYYTFRVNSRAHHWSSNWIVEFPFGFYGIRVLCTVHCALYNACLVKLI